MPVGWITREPGGNGSGTAKTIRALANSPSAVPGSAVTGDAPATVTVKLVANSVMRRALSTTMSRASSCPTTVVSTTTPDTSSQARPPGAQPNPGIQGSTDTFAM